MALEVKSRFVRRGAPKVKTGCITCRRRKVKCGEEKPGCQRCLKFGIPCDGYKAPRSKKAEKEARLLALIPKPVPIVPKQPLVPPPTTNLFKNDLEYRYFQRFCQESALQLTGHLDSNLWNQVILQTSESEPCIRHAVAAIGALNFNSLSSEHDGIDKLQFAYRAYGQAIVQLKASIEKGQASIRTKLLACLLFACFEFYHGNNDIASAQILSGVDMMRAYTKSHSQDCGTGTTLPPPNPEKINADIADALGVLEISSSSYSDPRTTQLHLDRMQCDQSLIDNIPNEFKNLKAARPTLLAIMLRALHYVLACRKSNVPDTFNMFAHVDPSYSQLCKYFDEMHRWHKAFQPLLDKARNERSKCEHRFRKATYQEVHYLSYYLYLASAGPWQMYYTSYTKELAEIIRLVKVLLEPSKNDAGTAKYNSTYSLNLRLIMPLNAVGLPYRHRALRKEAIDILASMNAKRDGAFDARITSKIMQWMAGLEEESALGDAEYVPYYLAAKAVKMRVDVQANKAFVVVRLPRRSDPSKSDMKEATIYGGEG